jgi:uncharacterized RDD family membrane protein YckC
LAGLGKRVLSVIYEALLLFAVLCLAAGLYTIVIRALHVVPARTIFQAYLFTAAGGYFVWQWVRGGQTLPMKTWRMRLVDGHNGPLTARRAAARYALAAAGIALLGAGYWWAFLDRDRQFLHDRLAGTRIIAS